MNPESAMANPEKIKLHIAMLPWLAFGHMIPCLELAKILSQRGIKISFISTPRNIQRLPKLPTDSQITFVEFRLPSIDGLPESAEATSDLPYNQVPLLKLAYDQLQTQLSDFLEASPVDWLFVDFVPYWAIPIAARYSIPTVYFSIFIASTMVYIGPTGPLIGLGPESLIRTKIEDFIVKPIWVPFDSNVTYRYFEVSKMFEALSESNLSGVSDFYRFGKTLSGCDVMAIRSCYELEPKEFKLLEDIHRKPVIPIGPLPPDMSEPRGLTDTWCEIKEWLDDQEKNPVVYVAFGSEATLDREELANLALGLEMSGFSFFWVLRTQQDELPEGFEERTKKRGVIWTSWAPQLKILGHDSVAAMLSHSGWSSVVEAVTLRKPLVLFTVYADQGLNAKFLESKEMAYLIPRDEKDGSFTGEAVAESLRLVVEGEEGKVYREKVKEMSEVIGDMERQRTYTDKFVDYLLSYKKGCSN